jgi:hypothetical protein
MKYYIQYMIYGGLFLLAVMTWMYMAFCIFVAIMQGGAR